MRSDEKSTLISSSSHSVSAYRQGIASAARDLTALDRQLGAVAKTIEPKAGELLHVELRAGIDAVRSELLADAIATLTDLAQLTEADVPSRRAELADLASRLSGRA